MDPNKLGWSSPQRRQNVAMEVELNLPRKKKKIFEEKGWENVIRI